MQVETLELPSWEVLVQQEIKKFDLVVPAIEQIKSDYMPLAIKDLSDKEGYDAVCKGLRFLVSKRTAVEDRRKELKADSISFGKAVDNRAKEITAMLFPVEEHLRNTKLNFDNAIAEIEAQKEREKQAKILERQKRLGNIGMYNVGNEWQWANTDRSFIESFLAINIETFSDDSFDSYVKMVSNLNETEKKLQLDLAAQKEAERITMETQKAELERQQAILNDEKEKMQKEIDAFKKQVYDVRQLALTALGCQLSEMTGFIFYSGQSLINFHELSCTSTEWEEKLSKIVLRIEEIKAEQAKQAEIDAEKKIKELEQMKEKAANDAIENLLKKQQQEKDLQDKVEKEAADNLIRQQAKDKELKDKLDTEEKERVSNLSDKQKFSEYAKLLLGIDKPEPKTAKWTKELKDLTLIISDYIL